LLISWLIVLATPGLCAEPSVQWPGLRPDGSMLLPNQWTLRPAGERVDLGDFPVNIAVHPNGTFAAVLHCGYSQHEVVMVNLAEGAIASRSDVPEAFYGITFSRDGKKLYCSGASGEEVFVFDCAGGKLANRRRLALRDAA
jgi:DNA-binding beta-propeller fold protein YncE